MLEIFLCENNVSKGFEPFIEKLEEDIPEAEIMIEPCLGLCTDCAEIFYVIFESEMIYSDTPEELYNKIINYYSEEFANI